MSFEIVHPEKPTEQDKIDDNDYMLPHQINGVLPDFSSFPGMKARIPILIEEKIISSPVNSVTFENLNGDLDEIYYLEAQLNTTNTSANDYVALLPNNITINQTSSHFWDWGGGVSRFNSNKLILFGRYGQQSIKGTARLIFYSKTGTILRTSKSQQEAYVGTSIFIGVASSLWNDTTTNITSLVIKHTNDSARFTGTIKLYKLVDINLEDLTPT